MSKLFDYCTELAEKKVEEIMVEFRANKITKTQAMNKMLQDQNIRICLLEGMDVEQKQAVKDYFEEAEKEMNLVNDIRANIDGNSTKH
tara:strand:- start:462 stop:725 length:264 start_codon:yes stop_codon:yes gene_type:complete